MKELLDDSLLPLQWFSGGHGAGEIGQRLLPKNPAFVAELVAAIYYLKHPSLQAVFDHVLERYPIGWPYENEPQEFLVEKGVELLAEVRAWVSSRPSAKRSKAILRWLDEEEKR